MIDWKRYTDDTKLEDGRYLIWNGLHLPEVAILHSVDDDLPQRWFDRDGDGIYPPVTHYAVVQIPKVEVPKNEDPNQVTLGLDGKLRGGK